METREGSLRWDCCKRHRCFLRITFFLYIELSGAIADIQKKLIRWVFPVNTYKKGNPPKYKRKKMSILKLYGKRNVLAYTKKQTVKTACLLHG